MRAALWLFLCLKCGALFWTSGACPYGHSQAKKIELPDEYLAD